MPILSVNDLVSGYGKVNILNGVSLRVNKREIVTIIGPNGAGKSTLMRTIFGLVRVFSGSVTYNKENVTSFSPKKLVSVGMGFVPQSKNVFPDLTVRENLDMGAFTRKGGAGDAREEIFSLSPFLNNYLDKKAGELSGGQQRMLAIGMALMIKPKILLLDEPSAGLAPNLVDDLMEKISFINKKGVAILMVEQNAKRALKISNRGYVLVAGRNEFEGGGEAILKNPQIGKLYLGH